MPALQKSAEEILAKYQKDVERWKSMGAHYKDIQPLTIPDIMLIMATLHPTKKETSLELTKKLIRYLCERKICTAQEIYDDLGLSDKPVMKRMKVLKSHGLVRRESKKFYIPTPKLYELSEKYLDRVCS